MTLSGANKKRDLEATRQGGMKKLTHQNADMASAYKELTSALKKKNQSRRKVISTDELSLRWQWCRQGVSSCCFFHTPQ